MFCGSVSFKHVDEDPSNPASPKGSRKKANKNPYSTRGLDKYSTVLSELESKRASIMAKAGSQGIALVRFVYSNSHDWVPIIVRLKDHSKEEEDKEKALPPPPMSRPDSDAKESPKGSMAVAERKAKKSFSWRRLRPSSYWPLVIVLMLVCLVMFGRVFAICCTSIWWYLLPTLMGEEVDGRKSMKKEYGRRVSDKRLGAHVVVGPSSHAKVGGWHESISPRAHANGIKRG
ncbi:uncharacterized protein [Typha latifolia]|uniref:uncharacterized protein n=1 Tax=Typha latifolia TaxID=4733 RepID=UPI003C2D74F5